MLGSDPPPPPARQVGQPQPTPPSRHGDQGGGGGGVGEMGFRSIPPPAKQFSSRPVRRGALVVRKKTVKDPPPPAGPTRFLTSLKDEVVICLLGPAVEQALSLIHRSALKWAAAKKSGDICMTHIAFHAQRLLAVRPGAPVVLVVIVLAAQASRPIPQCQTILPHPHIQTHLRRLQLAVAPPTPPPVQPPKDTTEPSAFSK